MFSPATPMAGPSNPSRLRPSFSSPAFRRGGSIFPYEDGASNQLSSSRYSTPFTTTGVRIRSGSVFSREQWKKEELARRRQESRDKLKSSWDLLFEKYRDVEDDDEIDLATGKIVKDRGKLRALQQPMWFGQKEEDDDRESMGGGHDFESDEDELGDWDEKSGLDPQLPEWEEVEGSHQAWTEEDDADFREFMRAEQRRKSTFGSDNEDEDALSEQDSKESSGFEEYLDVSPRSRGTQILPLPTLDDLFSSDNKSSSEDELEAISDNDAEEKSARNNSSALPSLHEIPTISRRPRRRTIVEVMIPRRPRSKSTSGIGKKASEDHLLDCVPRSTSTPTLADLFTPPPAMPQVRHSPIGSSASSKSKGKKRISGERPVKDTSSGNGSIIQLSGPSNPTEAVQSHDGKLFRCDSCRVAGGIRKAKAPLYPGRTDSCIFEDSSRSSEQFARISATRNRPSGTSFAADIRSAEGTGPTRQRTCRLCREAGGERAKTAEICLGRHSYRRCNWRKRAIHSSTANTHTATPVDVAKDESNPSQVNVSIDTPQVRTNHSPLLDMKDPSSRPSSAFRKHRRRVIESVSDDGDPPFTTDTALPPREPSSNFTRKPQETAPLPSPPPTSSVAPSSPAIAFPHKPSRSPLLSLPPSSPPRPDIFSPVPGQVVHPTPSPSVSLKHPLSSNHVADTYKLSGVMYHPTPPPSIDGMRSASLSSDNAAISLPHKSALRRPSDSLGLQSSSSIKRTRFSLIRSPVHHPSSDEEGSEDELDLLSNIDSSSIIASSSSPKRSSSPIRTEWHVRAADVGIKLGPEHTGRLPSDMVKTLVPSMGLFRPTLGSSSQASSKYTLPAPPSSYRPSRPCPVSDPQNPSSGSGGNAQAGLMLPPPLPVKRLTHPNSLSTPKELKNSVNTFSTSSPAPSHIRLTSLPAVVVRARARSRSLSMAPPGALRTPRARGSTVLPGSRVPQTAPTRKGKVLMDLQRVAKEIGDEAGLEWGLDEETDDGGRMWREGSVAAYK
ncbi:hypothetical protein C365_03808 [Cryptococcus neoformans Bt85]|nr:hypothetical protein C365_03808 [Cryptococcus neoformans var. grubii Bt85]